MKLRLALAIPLFALLTACGSDDLAGSNVPAVDAGAGPVTASYSGRALFRGTQAPVADLTIRVAGAGEDGAPTDAIFGTAQTDTGGHFKVTSTAPRNQRVVLVAAAVEETAQTGGDRRAEGYEIRKHETVLGSLPDPSPTRSNTLLVNPNRPGRAGNE